MLPAIIKLGDPMRKPRRAAGAGTRPGERNVVSLQAGAQAPCEKRYYPDGTQELCCNINGVLHCFPL